MVNKILSWIGIAILVVAIYKFFGGDLVMAFNVVADFVISIVSAGSDILLNLLNSVFG